MVKRLFFIVYMFVLVLQSCVPHKHTMYFQGERDVDENNQVALIQNQRKPYRVQISDIISIRVKALDQETVSIFNPLPINGQSGNQSMQAAQGERAYYDGFTVDLHGNIEVPILGTMNVLGYTTEEIEDLIKDRLLKDQFKSTANLFVTVKLGGLRYVASGEIGSPGTKTLFQEQATIFEAVANAGEIPVTGNMRDVMLIRQYPEGQQIHHLDLTDINIMNSPYYYIQPNDMIYVKPLKVKTLGTGTTAMQALQSIVTLISLATTTIVLLKL